MKWYEGMFIINPQLRPEETERVIADIEGEIKKLNGEIVHSRRLGKKMLAYPIQKAREGVYLLLFFKLEPGSFDSLGKKLRLREEILRLLILGSSEQGMKESQICLDAPRESQEMAEY